MTARAALRPSTSVLLAAVAALLLAGSARAEDWPPSRFGADDTLGAVNLLGPEHATRAAKLVKTGRTYALGVVTGPDTPAYGPRKFNLTVLQLSDGTGQTLGSNRATGNDDLLYTFMGIGSQIDGLGHMGVDHVYYNGTRASEFVTTAGLTKLGTESIPPIVTRGVLLDMARHFGKDMLAEGTAFNVSEIEAAAKAQKVEIREGDVVLFHTGWLDLADRDAARFMAAEPGLGLEGARHLASKGVVAIGADTWALEVIPFEDEKQAFPVHPELLARNGVYILENMDTRALARDRVYEFMFVLGQPRFQGAVQAIINPVAIR
jgi:kynurenine formamidase